jgi:hypothetical protein
MKATWHGILMIGNQVPIIFIFMTGISKVQAQAFLDVRVVHVPCLGQGLGAPPDTAASAIALLQILDAPF